MNTKRNNPIKISKTISMALRHKPAILGICLDEHGWADVNALIHGIAKRYPGFSFSDLEEIVRTDAKQRYAFNADQTKIRANQGHSVPVDVELREEEPPEILYHGTGEKSVASILRSGLKPQGRLYVHCSKDIPTAIRVGKRHGKPVVYQIRAKEMTEDGYRFYLSANHIWLTENVPANYLEIVYTEN